jgi:hypothetical protein
MLFLAIILSAALAREPHLPAGITCDYVRAQYAEWSWAGKWAIHRYLLLQGYSWAQIREAEKCLR